MNANGRKFVQQRTFKLFNWPKVYTQVCTLHHFTRSFKFSSIIRSISPLTVLKYSFAEHIFEKYCLPLFISKVLIENLPVRRKCFGKKERQPFILSHRSFYISKIN